MKYKVHGASVKEVLSTVSVDGEDIAVKREAVEVEMLPATDYAKTFTHVVASKGPEDTAAILTRFPVDAEFEIEPAAIA